jgi:hypothetical protein
VTRNQNKSTSIEDPCIRISSNAGNQNDFVFAAIVPLGRGEDCRKAKNGLPQAEKSGKTWGKPTFCGQEINSGAHLRSSKHACLRWRIFLVGTRHTARRRQIVFLSATTDVRRSNARTDGEQTRTWSVLRHNRRRHMQPTADGWRTCQILHEIMRRSVASAASPTTSPC